MKKFLLVVFAVIAGVSMTICQNIVDFEELELAPDSHWDGSNGNGYFESKYLKFYNNYNPSFFSWEGFAYTNETDIETPGFGNQYSSAAGSGAEGSENYAVCFIGSDWLSGTYDPIPAMIKINAQDSPDSYKGMYISLNTYASLYMEDMSPSNDDTYENRKHWLKLHIVAVDSETFEQSSKDILMADYRFDSEAGFKLSEWTYIDLSWADGKDSLVFTMTSSDSGEYGTNTPAYFCIDNFGAEMPSSSDLIAEVKETYSILPGESVNLSAYVKGGIQPYSFTWSNESGLDNYFSQTPVANPARTTTYTLTITDSEGTEILKNVTVNVGNVGISNSIFKNLNICRINEGFIISNTQSIDNISIYDLTGKLIMEQSINNNYAEISTSHISGGIYLMTISSGKNKITKKISK